MHSAEKLLHVLHKVADMRAIERQIVPLWLKERRDVVLLSPKISALLFPNAHLANFYKKQLLDSYPTLAGLHFLTPSRVRAALKEGAQMEQPLASREDLFMLAHLALEKTCASAEFVHLREDPKVLVQAIDALIQAGWEAEKLGEEFKPFAKALNDLLKQSNLMTAQQLDQMLVQTKVEDSPFHSVLAIGFSGKDWSQYRILQALQRNCSDFALCLQTQLNSEADRMWMSSWENLLPQVEGYDVDEGASDLQCEQKLTTADLDVVVTAHEADEVEAIVYKALNILAQNPEVNVGIVTSEPSTLSREIALRLQQLNIPHNDCIRFNSAETPSILGLQQWVAYQHSPNLNAFLALVDQLQALSLINDEEVGQLKRDLNHAFCETLNDRMDILYAFLKRSRLDFSSRSLAILDEWCVLPEKGRLDVLIERTRGVCEALLSENVRTVLEEKMKRIENLLHYECLGKLFADWVYAVGHSPGRTAESKGRVPFAHVHLVSEHQSYGMTFDYVIFGGMIKSNWPRSMPEHPLLTDGMMVGLNREAEIEGRHGLGDRCIHPRLGYMPSQSDKKTQQRDRFVELMSGAKRGVVMTASLSSSNGSQSNNVLSEYLLEAAWQKEIQLAPIVHSPAVYAIAKNIEADEPKVDVGATRTAFERRRDASLAFDGYSYCFEGDRSDGRVLSCKAIEEAVQKPVQAWTKYILGIALPADYAATNGFALAQGNWIHTWVLWGKDAVGSFQKPELNVWLMNVDSKAQAQLKRIAQVYADCDQALPEWLQRFVCETQLNAQSLLKKAYNAAEDFDYCSQELKLGRTHIQCDAMESCGITTQGRIDVIFGKHALDVLNADNEVMVLDFKTGQTTHALSVSNLKKARGMQGALYGLCMKAQGIADYAVGYVTNHHQQVSLLKPNDIQEAEMLWRGLAMLLQHGRFGELPELAYGGDAAMLRRPLASTKLDAQVLKKKWELTHPLLQQSFES